MDLQIFLQKDNKRFSTEALKKKETKQNPDFKNRPLGDQVYLSNDSHFSLAINETRNYCFLGFVHMISNCSQEVMVLEGQIPRSAGPESMIA